MSASGHPAPPSNPFRNPSYPQRTHANEKAQWQGVLNHWATRVDAAAEQLDSAGSTPERLRSHAQMLGALDQIAEAARRLPGEVGHLYDEDKHRLELAVAALERLFQVWK